MTDPAPYVVVRWYVCPVDDCVKAWYFGKAGYQSATRPPRNKAYKTRTGAFKKVMDPGTDRVVSWHYAPGHPDARLQEKMEREIMNHLRARIDALERDVAELQSWRRYRA